MSALSPAVRVWRLKHETTDTSDARAGRIDDAEGLVVVYDEGSPSAEQAAHIARHDPASVLAKVEAWRRIVDHCERWLRMSRMPHVAAHAFALTVLRELATAYADRDGFDETWRTT